MKYDFDEVIERRGTYCTQWDYIEDRFEKKTCFRFLFPIRTSGFPSRSATRFKGGTARNIAIPDGIITILRGVLPDTFNGAFNAAWKKTGFYTVPVSCIPFLF